MTDPKQSGEDDRLSFSLSEEEAEDTADSLDIKPPQAVLQRKPPRNKKDKVRDIRHSHAKGHHSRSADRKKEYKIERPLREREISYRDSHKHKSDHRERARSKSDRDHSRQKKDSHLYKEERIVHERRIKELDDHKSSDQLLNELRGKLLDKRGRRETRPDEPERKRSKRDREKRDREEYVETEREKEERLQREERKAKLLEAEREMAMRKEVSRRELEARRERHNLEKEKDRMLREIAKKHKLEKEKEGIKSEGEEGEIADKTDEDDSDSSSSSSTTSSEDGSRKGDAFGGSPRVGALEKSPRTPVDDPPSREISPDRLKRDSPSRSRSRSRSSYRSRSRSRSHSRSRSLSRDHMDNSNSYYAPDSPKGDPILKDSLPPYLPAIQGCRSVEEFQCLNKIEEGTYGVVYRARDKKTLDIVALKRLKMEKEKEGFPITSLREINTLLKAQHPNIVTVREIVVGSNMDKIFIVMDYVEHDLKSLMETMKSKKQVFVPGEIKCIMLQLLRAVAHLHDNWILHRDLKTSNLLLSHKGILKVGDFGLAREYGSPLKAYTPVVVTLWYRAPELLLQTKEYTIAIDMWSVGCIFGELLQMEALFSGRSEMDQLNRIFKELGTPNEKMWPGYSKLPAIQRITFAEYPVNRIRNRFGTMLSDLGIGILNSFLTYDPVQRITAETALQHDYFKEVPLPIDPAMFPTWPAKSEQGVKKNNSPKPPSGGKEYKQLGDSDEEMPSGGFHMGAGERRANVMGPGFSLKF